MDKALRVFFLMLLVFMLTIGFMPSVSSAGTTWVNCTVTSVGPSNTDGYVQLTALDGSFTKRWFHLTSAATNSLLATAIAAFTSSGKNVQVGLTGKAAYSDVTAMYIY